MNRLAFSVLLAGVLGGVPLQLAAAPNATDEILSALQTRLASGSKVDDLVEHLSDLEPAELAALQKEFDQAWFGLRDEYLADFRAAAQQQHSGAARQARRDQVRTLRETFHQVRGMPEGPMKDALKSESWPAVTALRELLIPTAERFLESAGEALAEQRGRIFTLALFRDAILKAAIAVEAPESVKHLGEAEEHIMDEFSDLDRDGLRLMEKNKKAAASAMVPEAERRGIADLNAMRLLVGLPALEIDPKLCIAARGHSEDMSTLGFFSHTSPVDGKATPSDRARRAGTSGGGENIYVGSDQPEGANRGWFFSPGHHKNMFSPSYRRVGLGQHGKHWTQMFGR